MNLRTPSHAGTFTCALERFEIQDIDHRVFYTQPIKRFQYNKMLSNINKLEMVLSVIVINSIFRDNFSGQMVIQSHFNNGITTNILILTLINMCHTLLTMTTFTFQMLHQKF